MLVMVKEPLPGRVKTRLSPAYSATEAAALAEAALADTFDVVRATPARRRVAVLEGDARWLPRGVRVVAQTAGGLDERIASALARFAGQRVVLIGMDTPQLTPAIMHIDWDRYDAAIGPAEDGGFWLLGLDRADPALVRGVPMSTPITGAVQRARLVRAGLRVQPLTTLRDVDTAADAQEVAKAAPATRFAQRVRELGDRTREVVSLAADRWDRPLDHGDDAVLSRCAPGPVLDIGCGPGRVVKTLTQQGVACLGIDIAPMAVSTATSRGGMALLRDVFDDVPGQGRWPVALLLDGNVGLGGSPAALLSRVRELLRQDGVVLVEHDPEADREERLTARLVDASGSSGPDFAWAVVGLDPLLAAAAQAGLLVTETWSAAGRGFASLQRRDGSPGASSQFRKRPSVVSGPTVELCRPTPGS
jgi:glycosyltransferase A (GT-A) superfamily protein (DUF2064 family)/SAM-dependent methyltransferase